MVFGLGKKSVRGMYVQMKHVLRAFVGDPRVRKKNSEFLIGVLLS